MKIIKESLMIKQIPINLFYQENLMNRPCIVFMHGFENNKESGATLAKVLARKGFVVICFDAYMHGKRFDSKLNQFKEDEQLIEMYKIVRHTGKDIDSIIEFFRNDPRINLNKIGLTGVSMGAFTTFYKLIHNQYVKVAVPIIGLPTFLDFWMYYVKSFKNETVKRLLQEKDTEVFREYLKSMDPMYQLDKIHDIPILMLNGLEDEHVPYEFTQRFYEKILNHYKDKNLCQLKLYDVGHTWNKAMFDDAIDWFSQYLN